MSNPVSRWWTSARPGRGNLKVDAIAAVPRAIGSVPDGMASAVLIGVNPIHGLYASAIAPIAGGLSASTGLMIVSTTSAASLAAGSTLAGLQGNDRTDALFLLTILAGAAMIVAGILRLGRYVRFVSHSVMIGFLTGVAFNIILGQLPDLTGAPSVGRFALAKAWNIVTNPSEINLPSLAVGVSALALMAVLSRTKVGPFSALVALLVPTFAVVWFGIDSVVQVQDGGAIPTGLPSLRLPHLSALSADVVVGALAIAAIVLVQGSGVSESVDNPDGSRSEPDRDFVAQGIANAAAGLFQGQPVGGSVSQTALNVTAGARTRWAAIFSGVWILLVLVVFSGLVGKVALPTLAALLIFAAASSLRFAQISAIWHTGPTSKIAMVTTFVATLILPIPAAVGIGVALSLLLQLNQDAMDLTVVRLKVLPDGRLEEVEAPVVLPSNEVTVLDVYGSLLYAGAKTLQVRLPDPTGSQSPAVVLRLRHRTALGATFIVVVADYAKRVRAVGGQLYLSGIDPELLVRLRRTGQVNLEGPVRAFEATSIIGESTRRAAEAAEAWLVDPGEPPAAGPPSAEPPVS